MMPKAPYVLAAAITVTVLVPVSTALAELGPKASEGFYNNSPSSIADARGDATAMPQQIEDEMGPVPAVKDYHDIIGASVQKKGEAFFFTIYLAGNPNRNENYETMYRWHIIISDQTTGKEQQYLILIPNFHTGNSTKDGWYFGVYDVTEGTFKTPMRKIFDMPDDRVEFPVEDLYIGNPSSFRYWAEVAVRSGSAVSGPPDYLMDYAPKVK